MNCNALKSYRNACTPKLFKLSLPSQHITSLLILYTDSIKYLGYMFSINNSDDTEMLRQMRLLYCRSNDTLDCITNVAKMCLWNYVEVSVRHFIVLIFGLFTKKATFSKIRRVACNNVFVV